MLGKQINFDSCSGDIEWTNKELKRAQILIQTNFKNNILNNDGAFQFPLENDVGESLLSVIEKCYIVRKDEIRQYLIKEQLLKRNIPLVENIDWKLKWVMGSSSLITVSEPLLQLSLHCAVGSEATPKTINFEINFEQVDEIINKLEGLKKQLS